MRKFAIFWGVTIILIGILLLLNTLGIISVNIWGIIFSVFIIVLGMWIIWGVSAQRSVKVEKIFIPLDAVARAKVRIKHGAGRLELRSGVEEGGLVSGDCIGGAVVKTQKNDDFKEITLSVPDLSTSWMIWGPGSRKDWMLKFVRGVAFELIFEIGAAEGNIDLSDLWVTTIRFNSGASSTRMILPASAGRTTGEFKIGATSLELIIPSGVAARINASGGLASIKVDLSRFPRSGGFYQSPDYDTSMNIIDIQVETGVGSIEIH